MVLCCFCKKPVGEHGNNALPVKEGVCCDECNEGVVMPIRLAAANGKSIKKLLKGVKVK